jgi:hypothetical protein
MEWKWTKGEPYERSRRIINNSNMNINSENDRFSKEMESSAYSSSLNHDEYTWDILNQSAANNGFKVSNKREELDSKIADRGLIQQIGFNPFLGENNYIDDIAIRDQFLKPVNTTQDIVKNKKENGN